MIMPTIQGQRVTHTSAQLPVAIDYPAALALRQMALVQDEAALRSAVERITECHHALHL